MAESNPNPTRLTDPAARPVVTATIPSRAFHPIVAAFSDRARRTATARSEPAGRNANWTDTVP
jgi:hypothetical protein